MNEYVKQIERLKNSKKYLICLDSDGTVFNSQEIKFKKFIIPCMIHIFGLEEISSFVSETAEYVNLYSEWRGIGRYAALLKVFDMLKLREEIRRMRFTLPDTVYMLKWLISESKHCKSSLLEYVKNTQDPFLIKVSEWDNTVDQSISNRMKGIPKFKYVSECLERASKYADIIVVSSEASDILRREWEESGLVQYVNVIAGREVGTKKSIICNIKTGRYLDSHILMIGDALGDLESAKANNILFYPIIPKREIYSWKRFYDVELYKFVMNQYSSKFEDDAISEFQEVLESIPPWEKSGNI
ncbi:MAG TPA: hypothetical protein VIK78_16540 [Ruminiclostridium sp.]